MRSLIVSGLLAIASVAGTCEDLPDTATLHQHIVVAKKVEPKFWTKERVAETTSDFVARSIDAAQSCYILSQHPTWHESVLPVKSCAGISLFLEGEAGLETFGAYELNRLGYGKLSHVPHWVGIASSAFWIIHNSRLHQPKTSNSTINNVPVPHF